MYSSDRHSVRTGIVLTLLLATAASAEVEQTYSNEIQTRANATTLSETDLARAEQWQLDAAEWQRYDTLLKGIRGSVSPLSLSPIEVLGIHARDDAERRHYAERWARAMREDAERILAFQRAYDAAFRRLFDDQQLIDVQKLSGQTQKTPTFRSDDRLLFFSGADCPPCDTVFARLITHIEALDGVDVYFLDGAKTGEQDIRDWAKRQKLDASWVRTRRITLNRDNGLLKSITSDARQPPLLFLQRDGAISPLSYAEL